MKRFSMLGAVIVALLFLGFACTKEEKNTNTGQVVTNTVSNANQNRNTALNVNDDEEEILNSNSSSSSNTNTANEADEEDENTNANANSNTNASDDEEDASGTLTVTEPERNAELESPFVVRGASSAEKVYVRVKSASGVAFFTETVTVRNGAYRVNLTVALTNTTSGSIEVFEKNAAGAETNLVSVPVDFTVAADEDSSTNENTNANENEDANLNTNSY